MSRKRTKAAGGRAALAKRLSAVLAVALLCAHPLPARGWDFNYDWSGRYKLDPDMPESSEGLLAVNLGGHAEPDEPWMSGSFTSGGTWGYINAQGELVIPAIYSRVDQFSNGRAVVQMGGDTSRAPVKTGSPSPYWNRAHPAWSDEGVGVIDRQGRQIIACVWEDIRPMRDGSFKVLKNEKWGLMDRDGKLLIPPKWDWLEKSALGYVVSLEANPYHWDGKYGLLDSDGNELLPPVYAIIGEAPGTSLPILPEGLLSVAARREQDAADTADSSRRIYGYTDALGEFVIQPAYRQAEHFQNGLAWVRGMNEKWGIIDRKGRWVREPFADQVSTYRRGGLCNVETDKELYVVDVLGQAPPQEGVAAGKARYAVDILGRAFPQKGLEQVSPNATVQWLGEYEKVEPFQENRAAFRTQAGASWGYLDYMGRQVIPPAYDEAGPFQDGRAVVRMGESWGVVGVDGEELIPADCQAVVRLYDGTFKCKQDGLWGLADWNGKRLIQPRWRVLDYYAENRYLASATAKEPGAFGDYILLDRRGTQMTPRGYSLIEPCFNGRGLAATGTPDSPGGVRYGYLDARGNLKIPPIYGSAKPFAPGAAWVSDGSGGDALWGLIDADGFALTEQRWLAFEEQPPPSFFSDSLWKVGGPEGAGIIEKCGDVVIPAVYEEVGECKSFGCAVKQDGLWGYFEPGRGWTIPPKFGRAEAFQSIFAAVQEPNNGRWGLIDNHGVWLVPAIYDGMGQQDLYNVHWAVPELGGRQGLLQYDQRDNEQFIRIFPPCLASVELNDNNGNAIWSTGHVFGIVNPYGAMRAAGLGSQPTPLRDGRGSLGVKYRLLGKWGMVGNDGEPVAPARFDDIDAGGGGPCLVREGNRWGLLYF